MKHISIAVLAILLVIVALIIWTHHEKRLSPPEQLTPPGSLGKRGSIQESDTTSVTVAAPDTRPESIQPLLPSTWLHKIKKGQTGSVTFPEGWREYYFVPIDKFKEMPRLKATLLGNQRAYAFFTTPDGKNLSIGGPAASREIMRFLRTLKEGETCLLPDAYITSLKQQSERPNKADAGDGK